MTTKVMMNDTAVSDAVFVQLYSVQLYSNTTSYSKSLVPYNTFLKNLCPALFGSDSYDSTTTGRKNNYEKRKERAGKIWHPWGRSGGGAPVLGPTGRPIADRTEMRRNAG